MKRLLLFIFLLVILISLACVEDGAKATVFSKRTEQSSVTSGAVTLRSTNYIITVLSEQGYRDFVVSEYQYNGYEIGEEYP
jgi:hypothetical protein